MEITAVEMRQTNHVTTFYPKTLALTSLTSGGRSVDMVRSRTKATELLLLFLLLSSELYYIYSVLSKMIILIFKFQKIGILLMLEIAQHFVDNWNVCARKSIQAASTVCVVYITKYFRLVISKKFIFTSFASNTLKML
jgi:hypothetical protein